MKDLFSLHAGLKFPSTSLEKYIYTMLNKKLKYIWLKPIIHNKLIAIRVIWSKKHF